MLTDYQIDALIDPIISLYRDFTDATIIDIARRLGNMSFSSAAWQVQRLSESGALYEDILERLSELTGKSEVILRDIFQKAGVRAIRFDDSIYIKAGLQPIPLNLSPAMTNVLFAGLQKAGGLIHNLTMTTAISGQEAFIKAADMAYMEISTGAFDYNSAIKHAVKEMASQGIGTVNYANRVDFADVAVRRAVLTGVNQTAGELQMERTKELGVDLVQTSAHAMSRPEHEEWQGQIFSLSGTSDKYPDFVTSTGYGEVDGLMGINCRHVFFPFFEGISDAAYTEAELESLSNKTVTYNEKEISGYDASQIQRGYERQVRSWKRQSDALEAAGSDNSLETAKVRDYQAKLRDLIKQTNLTRQSSREQI